MTSRRRRPERSTDFLSSRHKSPSVKTPSGFWSASTAKTTPSLPFDKTSMASSSGVCGCTTGRDLLRMTSCTLSNRRRPKAPAGCERAKSSRLKCLATMQAPAIASPNAIVTVVEDVGARFRGQASRVIGVTRLTSEALARELSALPVMQMILTPIAFKAGRMVSSSSDSPEKEMATNTSSFLTIPKSP